MTDIFDQVALEEPNVPRPDIFTDIAAESEQGQHYADMRTELDRSPKVGTPPLLEEPPKPMPRTMASYRGIAQFMVQTDVQPTEAFDGLVRRPEATAMEVGAHGGFRILDESERESFLQAYLIESTKQALIRSTRTDQPRSLVRDRALLKSLPTAFVQAIEREVAFEQEAAMKAFDRGAPGRFRGGVGALGAAIQSAPVIGTPLAGVFSAELDIAGLAARILGQSDLAQKLFTASTALEAGAAGEAAIPRSVVTGLIEETVGADPGAIASVGRGVTRSLTKVLAAGKAGGAWAIIGLMTVDRANQAFGFAVEEGLSPEAARDYALRAGLIEGAITTAFQVAGAGGLESLYRQSAASGVKAATKAVGVTLLAELPENLIIEAGQAINDEMSGLDPEALTYESLRNRAASTTVSTIAGVMALSAGKVIRSRQIGLDNVQAAKDMRQQLARHIPGFKPTEAELVSIIVDARVIVSESNGALGLNNVVEGLIGRKLEADMRAQLAKNPDIDIDEELGAGPTRVLESQLPSFDDIPGTGQVDDQGMAMEQLLDTWLARRDVRMAGAYADRISAVDELNTTLARLGKKGVEIKFNNAVEDMQLFIDLKQADLESPEGPSQMELFGDKLTPLQRIRVRNAENLHPDLQALADRISDNAKGYAKLAQEAGIRINIKDNFAHRIWQFPEDGNPEGSRNPARWLRSKFSRTSNSAKQRTLSSILDGWSKGFELRVPNLIESNFISVESTAQAIEDRNVILTGKKLGLLTTSPPRGENWVQIQHPSFYDIVRVGAGEARGRTIWTDTETSQIFTRERVFAEPKLAKALNNILNESALKGIPFVDAASRANLAIKHSILSLGLFHHQAFLRSYMLASHGLDPVGGYRAGRKAMKNFTPMFQEMVAGGMTTGRESMRQDFTTIDAAHDGIVAKVLGTTKTTDAARKAFLRFREWNTNVLFNKLGTYLKVNAGLLEFTDLLTRHDAALQAGTIKRGDLAKQAANLVNDDFGGLNLARLRRNKTTQQVLQLSLLAPDWFESNFRMFFKQFKPGQETALYRRANARVAVRGAVSMIVANYVMSAFDDEDFVQRYQTAWKEGDMRWMQVDITPIWRAARKAMGKDATRRRMYWNLMGQFLDPTRAAQPLIESVMDPEAAPDSLRFAKGRMSVLGRIAVDAFTGTNYRGNEFSTWRELLAIDDKPTVNGFNGEDFSSFSPQSDTGPRLTTGIQIGRGGLALEQLPSFGVNTGIQSLPISIQSGGQVIFGEMDEMEAVFRAFGFGVSTTRDLKTTGPQFPGLISDTQE